MSISRQEAGGHQYLYPMVLPRTALGNSRSLQKIAEKQHILEALKTRDCPLEKFAQRHGVTRKTLYNLRKKKVGSLEDLIDQRHIAVGRPARRDDRALAWALAYKEAHPKAAIKQIWHHLTENFKNTGIPVPTYGQLRHSFRTSFKEVVDMIERGGKGWFQESAITIRREVPNLNAEWQIDATQMDTWVLSMETMRVYRQWLLSVIDSSSRVVLAADVLEAEPTAKDGLLLMRRAILPKLTADSPFYGLPASIVPDNHAIWKSATFVEGMLRAGIHIVPVPVDAPQAKGKKERWFRTIKEQLCQNLIGYTGQSNGLAKANQRAIPAPLMQGLVNKFLLRYHATHHSALGLSPWECWHERLDSAVGLLFDAQLIQDSFKVVETADVKRDGIRTLSGHHLYSDIFGSLVDEQVTLRVPLDGRAEGVEAYYRGVPIGDLRIIEGNEELANQLQNARLNQTLALKGIRKTLRAALKKAPPLKTPAVDVKKQRAAVNSPKPPKPRPTPREIPDLPTE